MESQETETRGDTGLGPVTVPHAVAVLPLWLLSAEERDHPLTLRLKRYALFVHLQLTPGLISKFPATEKVHCSVPLET